MNKVPCVKHAALLGLIATLALTTGCTNNVATPVGDIGSGVSARTPSAPVARAGEHVVRPKETVYAIARLYNVSPHDIIAWNGLTSPDQIEIGQVLRVSPEAGLPPSTVETIPVAPPSDTAYIPPPTDPYSPPPVVPPTHIPPAAVPPTAQVPASAPVEVKREPRGGKEPYSDEAWARLQSPTPMAPSATISTDSPSPPAVPQPPVVTPPVAVTPPPAPAATGGDDWIWPSKGQVLVRFGESVNGGTANKGIDIAGTLGAPVVAAASGKVKYVGTGIAQLGKLVIIEHSDKYLTAYGHNRAILVKENEQVKKGQKIAELGDSGTSPKQAKLHFELRRDGQPVDPLKYLPSP